MPIPIHISPPEFIDISRLQNGSCGMLKEPGIIRFLLNGRVVFIAYAASPKPGIGGRIAAYRRGDVKSHHTAQLIATHKDQLELQIAFLDLPRSEIRAIATELKRREKPAWNKKSKFAGRF